MNWFECKVSYEKKMETGLVKKVNEPYLVDVLSHAEAEAWIIEEMNPDISGGSKIYCNKRNIYSFVF